MCQDENKNTYISIFKTSLKHKPSVIGKLPKTDGLLNLFYNTYFLYDRLLIQFIFCCVVLSKSINLH